MSAKQDDLRTLLERKSPSFDRLTLNQTAANQSIHSTVPMSVSPAKRIPSDHRFPDCSTMSDQDILILLLKQQMQLLEALTDYLADIPIQSSPCSTNQLASEATGHGPTAVLSTPDASVTLTVTAHTEQNDHTNTGTIHLKKMPACKNFRDSARTKQSVSKLLGHGQGTIARRSIYHNPKFREFMICKLRFRKLAGQIPRKFQNVPEFRVSLACDPQEANAVYPIHPYGDINCIVMPSECVTVLYRNIQLAHRKAPPWQHTSFGGRC